MRAAVTEAFGGIDRIVVGDLPKPVPGPGEVLVRVKAVTMNPLDCKLREGQRVLLNGAGGGIGTFAIQIAWAWGARVAAVASARNQDLLRELGADECLDYAREDFARREAAFDVIFDVFPLDAIRDAHVRMQSGHARSKIVVCP